MTGPGLPLAATPATLHALSEARATAVLVGSYDGSGNSDDIAQLDAALQLLEPLGPELLVLPVLERAHRGAYREQLTAFQSPPDHALFFDPEGSSEDDLLPVSAPPRLAAGVVYLYGGDCLDPSREQRVAAMARASTELLQAAGDEPVRLGSGDARAKTALLGQLAGGAIAGMAGELRRLEERLRESSTEPAALLVELAALRTEVEELRRPAIEAAVRATERHAERAEERARQAEERAERAEAENAAAHQTLAELLESRSWKLGAPLRRIGGATRRHPKDGSDF